MNLSDTINPDAERSLPPRKEVLLGKTLPELEKICAELGLPSFAPLQIADWLYVKRVDSFERMTNISQRSRSLLKEKYRVGKLMPQAQALSQDGTKKYLFHCTSDEGESTYIETVMIPDRDRTTVCVSSEAGCRMGCRFCMTGRQGFHGRLSVAQILSQIFFIAEAEELTNVVFMGMGEPLDNLDNVLAAIRILTASWGCGWSPKRITLSTIGVNATDENADKISPLERFLKESDVHLAISLHNPFSAERESIMPAEHKHPLSKTMEIIRRFDFSGQRRVSFEYIMFEGLNDSKRHADALSQLLKGLRCRVNLIRFHDIGDTVFKTSSEPVIESFKKRLEAAGVVVTVRASRGEDIAAACGMLSGQKSENSFRSNKYRRKLRRR